METTVKMASELFW